MENNSCTDSLSKTVLWKSDTVYIFNSLSEDAVNRYIYSYNQQGFVLIELFQIWQNDIWVNENKQIYTYDTNNNLLTDLHQRWENENWKNVRQSVNTYDTNNNILILLSQTWLKENWINQSQMLYTYDENSNCVLVENLKQMNNGWQPYENGVNLPYNNMQNSLNILGLPRRGVYKVTATFTKITKPNYN